jgi:polyhydroxybutyrate depolymerase
MVLLATALAGCTTALPRAPGQAAATYKAEVNIQDHGFERSYLVHLPPGYDDEQLLPMVVVLHGAFGNAKHVERFSGFSDLADEKQFIALYPNGIGKMGYFQHWNAGHCCGKAQEDDIDDVGFIAAVIEDACSRLAVDRSRIFMVGFSNGGMLTYRFAAERGQMLAAIAPLAASAGGRSQADRPEWFIPEPVKPLPVIAMHGLTDEHVPFEGGTGQAWKSGRQYWPVLRSLEIWTRRNGCAGSPIERADRQGKVHVRTWKDCRDNTEVVLYTLEGWPHKWPSLYYSSRLDPQDPLFDFDAARLIWEFFDQVP